MFTIIRSIINNKKYFLFRYNGLDQKEIKIQKDQMIVKSDGDYYVADRKHRDVLHAMDYSFVR